MDRLAKWASGGSLAWLVVAVGLTLGTHGGSLQGAGTTGAAETPSVGKCPDTPVAVNATFSMEGDASS